MPSLEKILVESSRELTDIMVAEIGDNQSRFDEIMELVYIDRYPVSMRASWVAYLAYEKYPHLTDPHIERILEALRNTKIDGVKRSGLKIAYDYVPKLSEDSFGELADLAFNWAEDPRQAIAVRAFSIDILLKVIEIYPEAKPEVIAILEAIIPDGSRGLKNKCHKSLKVLRQNR